MTMEVPAVLLLTIAACVLLQAGAQAPPLRQGVTIVPDMCLSKEEIANRSVNQDISDALSRIATRIAGGTGECTRIIIHTCARPPVRRHGSLHWPACAALQYYTLRFSYCACLWLLHTYSNLPCIAPYTAYTGIMLLFNTCGILLHEDDKHNFKIPHCSLHYRDLSGQDICDGIHLKPQVF